MVTGLYMHTVERSASGHYVNAIKPVVFVKRCVGIYRYHIESEHICYMWVDNMFYGISVHFLAYWLDTVMREGILKARSIVLKAIKHFIKAKTLMAHKVGNGKS